MAVFQHILWGYGLSYPDHWAHRTLGALEGFAETAEAFDPDYSGPHSGQILVRGEWNCLRQPIEPIWNRHIGMLAGWVGAKKLGSAPWRMGGAVGLEAEIVLPQKDNRRLWTGILEHEFTVLHFVVLHIREERAEFEPQATQIISSLRFLPNVSGVLVTDEGLPLPPGYIPANPQDIVDSITNPDQWLAYDGQSSAGALQAFYWREAPHYGWQITEYVPFPSPAELGFARFSMAKGNRTLTLGIMPYQDQDTKETLARLVFKMG
ncbi:MAG: hypothetical protein JXB15_13195 [Anaerolineales bacterium]|nr:hypothetical protein [Anaerolineales bacterium]